MLSDAPLAEYRVLLLRRLEGQPADVAALIAAAPEAEWRRRQTADGANLSQLLVHVRDAERLAYWPRIQRILAEDAPLLDQFPHHRWSLETARPAEPLAEVAADFTRTRAEVTQRLQALPPEAWSRSGFHPPSGPRTLQWWVERLYTHARNHLTEWRAILAQPAPRAQLDPYAGDFQ